MDKFHKKYVKDESGCWNWIGTLNTHGYGYFWNGAKRIRAHRFSYFTMVGEIPAGLELDHLCRNRKCVNPAHLEPVTSSENSIRSPLHAGNINKAKTYCKYGHLYDRVNTEVKIYKGKTRRRCRACRAAAEYKRRLRLKEKL